MCKHARVCNAIYVEKYQYMCIAHKFNNIIMRCTVTIASVVNMRADAKCAKHPRI